MYRKVVSWKINDSSFFFRPKTPQSQLDILDKSIRRSGRKREDKSYVEFPDIVIEEDQVSKPSPPKRPNLNGSGPTNNISSPAAAVTAAGGQQDTVTATTPLVDGNKQNNNSNAHKQLFSADEDGGGVNNSVTTATAEKRVNNSNHTGGTGSNGIQMESDEDEDENGDEIMEEIPTPKVSLNVEEDKKTRGNGHVNKASFVLSIFRAFIIIYFVIIILTEEKKENKCR